MGTHSITMFTSTCKNPDFGPDFSYLNQFVQTGDTVH